MGWLADWAVSAWRLEMSVELAIRELHVDHHSLLMIQIQEDP
jgi:hypothetical protein